MSRIDKRSDGMIRCSLRSLRSVGADVSVMAAARDGGGHKLASGFEIAVGGSLREIGL